MNEARECFCNRYIVITNVDSPQKYCRKSKEHNSPRHFPVSSGIVWH
eukprot:UN05851